MRRTLKTHLFYIFRKLRRLKPVVLEMRAQCVFPPQNAPKNYQVGDRFRGIKNKGTFGFDPTLALC